MTETRTREYLQQVLTLDPQGDAADIVRLRRNYLAGADWIEADLADDVDPRTQSLLQLNKVRQSFWRLPVNDLIAQLNVLVRSPYPDVVSAALRLAQVAQQRDALRALGQHPHVHPEFIKALAVIFVAPPAEANRLRERELSWMRPEQNQHFDTARRGVQGTANVIRTTFPGVFALESAWLTEILEYRPSDEMLNQDSNWLFGVGAMMLCVGTIAAIVLIIKGIFFS